MPSWITQKKGSNLATHQTATHQSVINPVRSLHILAATGSQRAPQIFGANFIRSKSGPHAGDKPEGIPGEYISQNCMKIDGGVGIIIIGPNHSCLNSLSISKLFRKRRKPWKYIWTDKRIMLENISFIWHKTSPVRIPGQWRNSSRKNTSKSRDWEIYMSVRCPDVPMDWFLAIKPKKFKKWHLKILCPGKRKILLGETTIIFFGFQLFNFWGSRGQWFQNGIRWSSIWEPSFQLPIYQVLDRPLVPNICRERTEDG